MGNIKQTYITRVGDELLEKFKDDFNTDFAKNKKAVNKYVQTGKGIRNKIAGYITRAVKKAQKAVV